MYLTSGKFSKLLFHFLLSGIFVAACTQDISAKTSKQKRLNNIERYNKTQEVGKSILGIKLGFFTSTLDNNSFGGRLQTGDGIMSSVSFDARVSPTWYVGTVIDIGRGVGSGSSSSALFNMSLVVKASLSDGGISGVRIGFGPGFALVRDGYGNRTAFLSGKFALEGLYQTRPRFGWIGDVGVSLLHDMHDYVRASGTQMFMRVGIAFL